MKPIITDGLPKSQPEAKRKTSGLQLALIAGLLLFLANPPIGLWPLAWVALAPLILSVTNAKHLGQATWRGYLFGWAFLGPTWYWVGLTINAWTDSHIGWIAWFGLTLILAGFYALWGGTAWWLARRTTPGWRIVTLAAAWAIMEWLRTLGTITMPWAQLSYTQWHFLPLLQMADVTGAYGISFVLLLVNGGIAYWWKKRKQSQSTRYLWASVTLTVLICFYGVMRMQIAESGPPLAVAAMQDNFSTRHDPDMNDYARTVGDLTSQAMSTPNVPELYVWSEASAPADAYHDPNTRTLLADVARQTQAAIVVGSEIITPQPHAIAHSSVLFPPDGTPPLHYDKQQLVPFGEFIPFREQWPTVLSQSFGFFPTDVTPGSGAILMGFTSRSGQAVSLGSFICYESMYPRYSRSMTAKGANLLITQSNDSWFQSRAAQEQHLAAVVLRAVENRRNVVRSTTNGITALLDSCGRIRSEAPRNTATFLTGTVTLRDGRTLYVRFGDWFIGLCGVAVAFAAAGRFASRKKEDA